MRFGHIERNIGANEEL